MRGSGRETAMVARWFCGGPVRIPWWEVTEVPPPHTRHGDSRRAEEVFGETQSMEVAGILQGQPQGESQGQKRECREEAAMGPGGYASVGSWGDEVIRPPPSSTTCPWGTAAWGQECFASTQLWVEAWPSQIQPHPSVPSHTTSLGLKAQAP